MSSLRGAETESEGPVAKMNIPSLVVHADSKFAGRDIFLFVDVRFRDRDQLHSLIEALIALRDGDELGPDHVHLQGVNTGRPGHAAEVTFSSSWKWFRGFSRAR